mmetsp:Transcript_3433/g.5145  ORF Transcript_3433/g.5145 Transcript_3433/m.5145 type:complete len:102 (+) Transcript_3433:34-339(+)
MQGQQSDKVKEFLRSQYCMQAVSMYMKQRDIFKMNKLNTDFYNRVVPLLTRNRQMFPSINPETHFVLKDGAMWAMSYSNYTQVREVDFEEDAWRHDNHYVF